MRAISTVSIPQRCAGVWRRRRSSRRAIRLHATTHAALVPPKPRTVDERDRRCAALCAVAPTPAAPAQCRIELAQRRDARHDAAPRARPSASVVSRMPAAAIRCPIAHLKPVTGGVARRTRAGSPRPPKRRTCGVPLPCATIMPTSRGLHARVVQRRADRALGPVAVVADREQALAFGRVAAAQHLAEHRARRARAPRLRVSSTSAPAPSPNRLPSRAASNGRRSSRREQAAAVVVQHHLRLDRRVVAHRDDAVGLAVAHRLRAPRSPRAGRRRCGW